MGKPRAPEVVFEAMVARVLRGAGVTTPEERGAAASTSTADVPAAVVTVIEKVRAHAYKVTDEDVDELRKAGLSEDAIFELVIAASVGVAQRRLDAAMAVIDAVTASKAVA